MIFMQPSLARYEIRDAGRLQTPALAIYPELVDANIRATLAVMGGDPDRWRPHVKTAKLGFIIGRMVRHGIENVKCSTTLELAAACESGVRDALVAYAMVGANARRVVEIAAAHPQVRVSILVENAAQAAGWRGTPIGLFIDVNPGMNRTGIEQEHIGEIVALAGSIGDAFRGIHYYDGQISGLDSMAERERVAHAGYDRLMRIVAALEQAGIPTGEVITSGTPAFPCAMSYEPFRGGRFVHRASPGTVVYSDATSLGQLSGDYDYQPAAVVVSTVVSHPTSSYITCDAGHKSVSADAGVPTCTVIGHAEFKPLKPSEEHLPVEVPAAVPPPEIGSVLYLVPRHICPTVNNFDDALIVERGEIIGVERVTARGHESPVGRASQPVAV
jgi:D-serine deaminase-like pyridoxal phosphate-dependent protein